MSSSNSCCSSSISSGSFSPIREVFPGFKSETSEMLTLMRRVIDIWATKRYEKEEMDLEAGFQTLRDQTYSQLRTTWLSEKSQDIFQSCLCESGEGIFFESERTESFSSPSFSPESCSDEDSVLDLDSAESDEKDISEKEMYQFFENFYNALKEQDFEEAAKWINSFPSLEGESGGGELVMQLYDDLRNENHNGDLSSHTAKLSLHQLEGVIKELANFALENEKEIKELHQILDETVENAYEQWEGQLDLSPFYKMLDEKDFIEAELFVNSIDNESVQEISRKLLEAEKKNAKAFFNISFSSEIRNSEILEAHVRKALDTPLSRPVIKEKEKRETKGPAFSLHIVEDYIK